MRFLGKVEHLLDKQLFVALPLLLDGTCCFDSGELHLFWVFAQLIVELKK